MDADFAAHMALYSALFFTALAAGGMILFAAAIAPTIHKVLDKAPARDVTRGIFPKYYLVLAIVTALAGLAAFVVNVTAGIVQVVIAGGFVFARQAMTPKLNSLNDEAARGSTVAKQAAQAMHQWSVRMNILQLVVLVIVFWFLALSAG